MQPLINIITRTSNRPIYFKKNRNSILEQTYKNIRHIISVDNKISYNYVKTHNIKDIVFINKNVFKQSKFVHNLYINTLLKEVKKLT